MQPCRSAQFQRKTNCFKYLVTNAKRLVSSDSFLSDQSCDHDKDERKILQFAQQSDKLSTTNYTRSFQGNQASRDLKRFLEEVGTDPKEARFWLRHFQELDTVSDKPFAIVEIGSEVFENKSMLERLASSLAFLYRNGMETVIVHGISHSSYGLLDKKKKQQIIEENIKLVDLLDKHEVRARPFLGSSHMISVTTQTDQASYLGIEHIDVSYIKQCLSTGHIPVITAVGETENEVVYIDPASTTIKLASILKPTKVIFLNNSGGLTDHAGKVIDCVSIPDGVNSILKQLKIDDTASDRIRLIADLIPQMPQHTSAVITSADSLIKELFTHHGSGTLFQAAEPIKTFHSFVGVDIGKLQQLITKSFQHSLSKDYFSSIEKHLHTLYITESYTAAAIIVSPQETCGIPYLDKFSISKESQGVGTSQVLWEKIKDNFPQLCWRSRGSNRINPWYFVRSTGSYQNTQWTVFWYGVEDIHITQKIINYTCKLPSSFDPVAPHDENMKKTISTSAYHKYI